MYSAVAVMQRGRDNLVRPKCKKGPYMSKRAGGRHDDHLPFVTLNRTWPFKAQLLE